MNEIGFILNITYFIKLLKLFYIILSLCYFIGFIWYIFCELYLDVYAHMHEKALHLDAVDINSDMNISEEVVQMLVDEAY